MVSRGFAVGLFGLCQGESFLLGRQGFDEGKQLEVFIGKGDGIRLVALGKGRSAHFLKFFVGGKGFVVNVVLGRFEGRVPDNLNDGVIRNSASVGDCGEGCAERVPSVARDGVLSVFPFGASEGFPLGKGVVSCAGTIGLADKVANCLKVLADLRSCLSNGLGNRRVGLSGHAAANDIFEPCGFLGGESCGVYCR